MLDLTATLLRALVTPITEGVVVSKKDGTGVVEGDSDVFEEYLGIKVPKRLVKWFKSPVRSEAFSTMFCEGGSGCGFEYNRVKHGIQFWVQKPGVSKRYLSGIYGNIDDAFSDLNFLCCHLCDRSVDLSVIGIKLAVLKDGYVRYNE